MAQTNLDFCYGFQTLALEFAIVNNFDLIRPFADVQVINYAGCRAGGWAGLGGLSEDLLDAFLADGPFWVVSEEF